MSGAEPCTGSKSGGNPRSGLMLREGAMPMVPAVAGPRSERMSPKRLEATITSKRWGLSTIWMVRPSMWYWSVFTSGYCLPIAAKRSSQYGMVIEMPFDLVAEVTCFLARVIASSKANFMIRSTPFRVKQGGWVTRGGVPAPPQPSPAPPRPDRLLEGAAGAVVPAPRDAIGADPAGPWPGRPWPVDGGAVPV